MAEAGELTLDAPVSPARVLPGQPLDKVADVIGDWWPSDCVRVGPFTLEQAPVPGEQGGRGHDPVQPEVYGQELGERGDHGAVGPVQLGPGGLAAQDSDLVPER